MKKIFLILSVLYFLAGCNNQKSTHRDTVTKYYNAFNLGDYNQIKPLINDSITIIEGDYIMPFTHESFYEQFKWDSIFLPTYKLIHIENQNDQIIATVASSSLRYKFLKNNPLSCRFKISFNKGKISKLEDMECEDADWDVWQKERDSLVAWVNNNHPELDGFIHDLTMKGAINYLKAIDLYKNRKNAM